MVSFALKLPYILAAIALVKASHIKGLAPEKQALYQSSSDGTWQCLDGSKVISYSAINDDYCDCPDGSDEPGTSACPNGYFYCENKGHIPAYIKSSAVNDGVCDEACCDGSDEESGQCPNRCQEVGEAYRKNQEIKQRSTEAGLKKKYQWIEEAKAQVTVWQEEKARLEDEIVLKKADVLKFERALKLMENQSKKSKSASNCPSCVEEIATLKHDVSVLQNELETLKGILHDMKRDHNHNFHDMAVKSAISGYDEFLNRYDQLKADIEADLKDIEAKESRFDNKEIDLEEDNESDHAQEDKESTVDILIKKLETILPEVVKTNVLDKLLTSKIPDQDYSYQEGDMEKTREAFEAAESELDRLNSELDTVNEELNFDYGKNREWLKLKDVCIKKDEGEYTYSLCFLGDAYQKSNKDHTRTHLGKFKEFIGGDVTQHIHDQGTRCWNGPERSVKAVIQCGVENEILEVSEPEKCEYLFRIISPAVCQEMTTKEPIHEEL
ncbi:hypothetical protein G6F46_006000 [Rhizopus delemar]|nr:hypothetical protein G6F55_008930 [Rhizopus delemar]KAG1538570.1 hypothetical protein G6F51_009692 [Rhizopus arrhizus]KAG1492226.1 hypothetical protein G6F54_009461 [Rhizopus delemar]KAG1508289.1 hypothetical protein G6F53_008305 [Rhizopus delemar]KAG1520743.1 hypothetical protein G6F52_007382 [Rhizopus delemar]